MDLREPRLAGHGGRQVPESAGAASREQRERVSLPSQMWEGEPHAVPSRVFSGVSITLQDAELSFPFIDLGGCLGAPLYVNRPEWGLALHECSIIMG